MLICSHFADEGAQRATVAATKMGIAEIGESKHHPMGVSTMRAV
jgi:hypothetical protein